MATSFKPDEMGQTNRPGAITALGIISFINTGFFLAFYGVLALFFRQLADIPYEEFETQARDAISQWMSGAQLEKAMDMVPVIYASGGTLMVVLFLRTLMRFIGVLGMWRGRRTGFATYAVAQVVGIFAPHIVLPWEQFSMGGALLALGMVAAYATQLKRMS